MKNKLKTLTILLIIGFAFNCQSTDDLIEETTKEKPNLKIQNVLFSEVKFLNKNAYEALKNYDSKITASAQRGTNPSNTYQIEQAKVKVVSNRNGYTSFTLPVIQPDRKLIQNLVFSQYKNGSSKITLNEYVLSQDYFTVSESLIKNYIVASKIYEISNPNLITARGFGDELCIAIGYYETVDKCEGELVTPTENPGCFNADGTKATKEVFITIAEDCTSTGGSDNGGNYGPPPGTTSGNGGLFDNGGGDGDGLGYGANDDNFDGVITSPNSPTTGLTNYELLASNVSMYLSTLPNYNSLFLSQNNASTKNMLFYTITNHLYANSGLTPENKNAINFVISNINNLLSLNRPNWSASQINATISDSIVYLLSNPSNASLNQLLTFLNSDLAQNPNFKITNEANASNSLVFNNINEIKTFLDSLPQNENQDDISNLDINQNTKLSTATIPLLGSLNKFKIECSQKISPYSISNVSSLLAGYTFGMNYKQTSSSSDPAYTVNGNLVNLTVKGSIDVYVFWEGLGTVYTNYYTFFISINKSNGNIISANYIRD